MKKNIKMNNIEKQDCTGCSICSSICHTKAIKINLSKEGFYEPIVDEEKCVSCGVCKKVCYKFDENILESEEKLYISLGAKNKSKAELETCTSGGVSIELMKEALNQNYKVVGVAYDYEKNIAITRIVDKENELEQFKGSKYFQSFTEKAFKEILDDKSEQKYAIFGTPCQIYAMSKFAELKNNREKYLLVDLFCHGCPSLNLWNKYLVNSKIKFNQKSFDNIEFRSKIHGWHEFGFKFTSSNKIYKSKKINDEFYELFFDMNTQNLACYECKMRSSLAYTDIRMGDYWGHQYDIDIQGVSAVILATEKGKALWNIIQDKFNFKEHTFKETVAFQSYGKLHKIDTIKRREILVDLNSEKDIKEIVKSYRKQYSKNKKIKKIAKNIVKCLPKSIYFKIKKIMHSI